MICENAGWLRYSSSNVSGSPPGMVAGLSQGCFRVFMLFEEPQNWKHSRGV
jgi:hypothetical protein